MRPTDRIETLPFFPADPSFEFLAATKYRFELHKPSYPHTLYHYPGAYPPEYPHYFIKKYSKPGDWVLDPFCGGGTTLVEAQLLGRNAIGFDINPVAQTVSRAKTTLLQSFDLEYLSNTMGIFCAKMAVSKPETEKQLLSDLIYECKRDVCDLEGTGTAVDFLTTCALAAIREKEPTFDKFMKQVNTYLAIQTFTKPGLEETEICVLPPHFNLLKGPIQLIMGSPPYLNQNYLSVLKAELDFMKVPDSHRQKIRKRQIAQCNRGMKKLGVPNLDNFLSKLRKPERIRGYFSQIIEHLAIAKTILAPGGYYVMLNSDNRIESELCDIIWYVREIAEAMGWQIEKSFGVQSGHCNQKGVPKFNKIETERFLVLRDKEKS